MTRSKRQKPKDPRDGRGLKVSELIEALSALPPEQRVSLLYDGFCLIPIGAAWLSQEDGVIVGGLKEAVYHDSSRAIGAVSEDENDALTVAEMVGLPEPEFYEDPQA